MQLGTRSSIESRIRINVSLFTNCEIFSYGSAEQPLAKRHTASLTVAGSHRSCGVEPLLPIAPSPSAYFAQGKRRLGDGAGSFATSPTCRNRFAELAGLSNQAIKRAIPVGELPGRPGRIAGRPAQLAQPAWCCPQARQCSAYRPPPRGPAPASLRPRRRRSGRTSSR